MAEVEWSKHKTEDGGCWGEVMMNRPERKNAITGLFGERLADAFEALQQDPEVQTILLYGAGGWTLSVSLASKLKRWELKMLRKILGVRKTDDESWRMWFEHTAETLRDHMQTLRIPGKWKENQ